MAFSAIWDLLFFCINNLDQKGGEKIMLLVPNNFGSSIPSRMTTKMVRILFKLEKDPFTRWYPSIELPEGAWIAKDLYGNRYVVAECN